MHWMVPEEKLGSDQNDVIEEISKIGDKTIWIKGHAGSGKSVVLIQSIKDYLTIYPEAKICVVVFANALLDFIKEGIKQIPNLDRIEIPVLTIYGLYPKIMNKQTMPYDAIFCDEVQDLPLSFILAMRNACKHFIIAGDSAQSIYSVPPQFQSRTATESEIINELKPIEKSLNTIYRLSKNIVKMLRNVYPELLDDLIHINKENTQIRVFKSHSLKKEIEFIWNDANNTKKRRPEDTIAILISEREKISYFVNKVLELNNKQLWEPVYDSNKELDFAKMNKHLVDCELSLMYVGNKKGSLNFKGQQNKVIIMTYHSSKGLDFNYVYLPLADINMYIHDRVNSLLLVALSRSKVGLTISYTSELYPGLIPFLKDIEIKNLEDINNSNQIIV